MPQTPEQLVAGKAASELSACRAAAGDDQPIRPEAFFSRPEHETVRLAADAGDFRGGVQLEIAPLECEPQHIHDAVCLIGIGIDPPAVLRQR